MWLHRKEPFSLFKNPKEVNLLIIFVYKDNSYREIIIPCIKVKYNDPVEEKSRKNFFSKNAVVIDYYFTKFEVAFMIIMHFIISNVQMQKQKSFFS